MKKTIAENHEELLSLIKNLSEKMSFSAPPSAPDVRCSSPPALPDSDPLSMSALPTKEVLSAENPSLLLDSPAIAVENRDHAPPGASTTSSAGIGEKDNNGATFSIFQAPLALQDSFSVVAEVSRRSPEEPSSVQQPSVPLPGAIEEKTLLGDMEAEVLEWE